MTTDKVAKLRSVLTQRLKRGPDAIGMATQEKQIRQLLSQTIYENESNSVLLTGPRGSGKSTTLNRIITEISNEKEFYTIYLDGLYQTDARSSLLAIQQQLNIQQDESPSLSFADRLTFLLNTFSSGSVNTIPIVFILESMDLFALHPKQILLYNLFDIVQTCKAPIAVIGITNRMDTLLLLEKRVKSRFSHRMIDFFPCTSFDQYKNIAKSLLLVTDKIMDEFNLDDDWEYLEKFIESVIVLLINKGCFQNDAVLEGLNDMYEVSNDVPSVIRLVSFVVSKLGSEQDLVVIFNEYFDNFERDQRTLIIYELSCLELCLLVSINKLLDVQEVEFNFELCYEEYRNFMKKAQNMGTSMGSLQYSKKVALKAFENLEQFGLLKFKDGVGSKCPKEYRMAVSLLTRTQIDYGLARYPLQLPDSVRKWATSN
jgi:origin recognition complex subunit 4